MLDYPSTINVLHTRGISVTLQEYFFVVQVVFGEDICVAYANTFDTAEFKRNVPSENEDEYLEKFKQDAQILLEKQNCVHLKEYIEQELQSYVQDASSTLKDYTFTGADIQRILSNLLHNRSESLDDASVKDIISLIKGMYESGALDSGDAFSRHFISIHSKFNALCTHCNHEMDAFAGVDCVCPHCGQVYRWDEQSRRFFPKVEHL